MPATSSPATGGYRPVSIFSDLILDKFRRSTLSLIYKNDCIWIEMIYERNDTVLNTVNGKPQQGFLLQIKPLILGLSGSTEFHDVR